MDKGSKVGTVLANLTEQMPFNRAEQKKKDSSNSNQPKKFQQICHSWSCHGCCPLVIKKFNQ